MVRLLARILYEQDHITLLILAALNDLDYPRNLFQPSTYSVRRNGQKADEQSVMMVCWSVES